jgi:hypothetical protein
MLSAKFGSSCFRSRLKYEKLTDGRQVMAIPHKTSSFGFIRPTSMAAVTKNRMYGKIARFW